MPDDKTVKKPEPKSSDPNLSVTTVEDGYYRFQKDEQIVIQRNELQKKVYDEYFVVKNYRTTTMNEGYAKKSKICNTIKALTLIFGLIMTIVGVVLQIFLQNPVLLVFGILFLIAAVISGVLTKSFDTKYKESVKTVVAPKKVMTDKEYEDLVAQHIKDMQVEKLGLKRLGLDEDQIKEIKPIVLTDKVFTKFSLKVHNPKENKINSSTHYVTLLYFTDEQLYVYKIQFDMCCNMQEEWASEFFYKDICDVSTYVSRNILVIDNDKFEYSTVAFKIVTTNSDIGFEIDGDNENVTSIQAMKQKIREKKNQ